MPLLQKPLLVNWHCLTLVQSYGAKPLTCLSEQKISTHLNIILRNIKLFIPSIALCNFHIFFDKYTLTCLLTCLHKFVQQTKLVQKSMLLKSSGNNTVFACHQIQLSKTRRH